MDSVIGEDAFDPIAGIQQAERHLAKWKVGDRLSNCEALHSAARSIHTHDAFYICMVNEEQTSLHYIYNVDRYGYDTPEQFPLGDGPTSWVVKNRSTLVLDAERVMPNIRLVNFGQTSHPSLASLHIPVMDPSGHLVWAVISPQWYEKDHVEEPVIQSFEWLAIRVGNLIRDHRFLMQQMDVVRQGVDAAIREERVLNSDLWIRKLESVCAGIAGKGELQSGEVGELLAGIQTLIDEMLPTSNTTRTGDVGGAPFMTLSDRELEVLALAAGGKSNLEIATDLNISRETIKHHMRNAFRKTGLRSRIQVARYAAVLTVERAARFRKSHPGR